jgi:hypothetical protein
MTCHLVANGARYSRETQEEGFFFEKKNQKTFVCLASRQAVTRAQAKKFFGSFFQKGTLLPVYPSVRVAVS